MDCFISGCCKCNSYTLIIPYYTTNSLGQKHTKVWKMFIFQKRKGQTKCLGQILDLYEEFVRRWDSSFSLRLLVSCMMPQLVMPGMTMHAVANARKKGLDSWVLRTICFYPITIFLFPLPPFTFAVIYTLYFNTCIPFYVLGLAHFCTNLKRNLKLLFTLSFLTNALFILGLAHFSKV